MIFFVPSRPAPLADLIEFFVIFPLFELPAARTGIMLVSQTGLAYNSLPFALSDAVAAFLAKHYYDFWFIRRLYVTL